MANMRRVEAARWVRAWTMSVTTAPRSSVATAGGRPGASRVRPLGPVTAQSTPGAGRPPRHRTRGRAAARLHRRPVAADQVAGHEQAGDGAEQDQDGGGDAAEGEAELQPAQGLGGAGEAGAG